MSKRINKPILAKYTNQLWGIDLIDMNELIAVNKRWRYIVTVVDIFSRRVFLAKIKNKEAVDVRNAFRVIVERAGVAPDHLMSDNGKEFLGAFEEYCSQNGIKQQFTRSYSPEANGVVENANKQVRRIMKAFFVRNGNKVWYNLVDKLEENKNNTYSSAVKGTPASIWTPSKEMTTRGRLPQNDPKYTARRALVQKAMRKIKEFKEKDTLEVGDLVRVKMSSIFANVRKLVKAKRSKEIVVNYTPELFVVKKVVKNRTPLLERSRYVLMNEDGRVLTKNGVTQMFYASELLLYTGEDASDLDIDMDGALELNGVERNENDVDY